MTDVFDARLVPSATGLLRAFNEAGVLAAADVHVARRLADLCGEHDEQVALAAALAVRAPRLGHVHVDLATIAQRATVDSDEPVDLTALPWPGPDQWIARVAASPLADGPLCLERSCLYLDRYLREERTVAADLRAFAATAPGGVREDVLGEGLARAFGEDAGGRQALAAAAAVRRRFAVIAGGPGTGKTTTVAHVVSLLREQARAQGARPPLIALAAPTGKAAARLSEAVGEDAVTLHRLLGWRPDSHSRFRHDRSNRLPHDVVIVDETSMVSLSLMARLVEAVRPDARLILVGDPGQLTSIEAGAVLGDIVGPAAEPGGAPPGAPVGAGIVVLDRVHRYGGAIASLAEAIRKGDADAALAVLAGSAEGVTWIDADVAASPDPLAEVRTAAVAAARTVTEAARAGAAAAALAALGGFRVLCAHRRGPYGVAAWTAAIEGWVAAALADFGAGGRWYPGRPLLVTENDYELGLYNGDTGVVVARADGRIAAAFERGGATAEFGPTRLGPVDTVYAMTVHKAQGSQFATAAVLLPDPASPILTRELLYTAVTRAQERLILAGTEEAVRTAVERPVARASGLRARLWG